jgi:hypothetical protein
VDKPPSRAVRYVRVSLSLLWVLSACPQLPPATKATQQVELRRDKWLLEGLIRRLIYGESRHAITPEYAKSLGWKPCEQCKPLQ